MPEGLVVMPESSRAGYGRTAQNPSIHAGPQLFPRPRVRRCGDLRQSAVVRVAMLLYALIARWQMLCGLSGVLPSLWYPLKFA